MVKLVKLRSCCKGFEDLYVVPGDGVSSAPCSIFSENCCTMMELFYSHF